MILVKCKCGCGCFYTLKKACYPDNYDKKCPNCGIPHKLDSNNIPSLDAINGLNLADDSFELRIIPDDAKFNISFSEVIL